MLAGHGRNPRTQGEDIHEAEGSRPHRDRARAGRHGRCRREALGHGAQRRRQHVRLAARLDVDAGPRHRLRLHGAVQRDRLRRRHPGDHQPHGRLRRLGRASDAGSVHCVQRLCPDPVGARRDVDPVQRPRDHARLSGGAPPSLRRRDRQDLHGPDHELERPGDQEAEPEGDDAGPEDHAGLPHGQLRHDLQLHRLPRGGQPDLEHEGRQGPVGFLADRHRRQRLRRRRRRRRQHARRHLLRGHRVRAREPAALRGDPERGRQVHLPEHPQRRRGRRDDHEGARRQRDAHRQPAEVGADGVPDRHLHLRHPADQVLERGGAAEDGLLGADDGPAGEVHGEALVRADPEGRARRRREDAQGRPAAPEPPRRSEGRRKAPLVFRIAA